MVELGNLTAEAVRWWAAVLAPGEGWRSAIPHERWQLLSPWSVTKEFDNVTLFLTSSASHTHAHSPTPASFEAALQYIEAYSALHSANTQSWTALAAAVLLPLAKLDNRKVRLHLPRGLCRQPVEKAAPKASLSEDYRPHLDRLLTLSANAPGMKAVLGSVFYQPGIPANACGAWLQGTMAVLQSKELRTFTSWPACSSIEALISRISRSEGSSRAHTETSYGAPPPSSA